jgi:hypothetical protein
MIGVTAGLFEHVDDLEVHSVRRVLDRVLLGTASDGDHLVDGVDIRLRAGRTSRAPIARAASTPDRANR